MKKLIIKELYATADRDNNYINISANREECVDRLENGNNKQETQVIKGYGIFEIETGLVPDQANDFYYDYEEAEHELDFLLNE